MNRVEIKKLAKEKIKGNKWKLLWPLLLFPAISFILGFFEPEGGSAVTEVIFWVIDILAFFFSVAYYNYLLEFVRTGDASFNTIINCLKKNWFRFILITLYVSIFVWLCYALFVIPGIIASISCSMVYFLVIDTDLKTKKLLQESRRMMNGHKWDYFCFELSFLGWIVLGIFTLGILYIWLVPYMEVSICLYYEKLRELTAVSEAETVDVVDKDN